MSKNSEKDIFKIMGDKMVETYKRLSKVNKVIFLIRLSTIRRKVNENEANILLNKAKKILKQYKKRIHKNLGDVQKRLEVAREKLK